MKHLFIIVSILATTILSLSITSCDGGISRQGMYKEWIFLPGECIIQNVMTIASDYNGKLSIYFERDNMAMDRFVNDNDRLIFWLPSLEVLSRFDNANAVRKAFYDIAYEGFSTIESSTLTSFVYSGSIHISLDQDIKGFPKGEDLSSLFDVKLEKDAFLKAGFKIDLPSSIREEIKGKKVTMSISIPVKKGMYLKWINDQILDPGAQMEYEDIVLIGSITDVLTF